MSPSDLAISVGEKISVAPDLAEEREIMAAPTKKRPPKRESASPVTWPVIRAKSPKVLHAE